MITINRATPYSWYVVSKNSGTQTAESATWKFYNAGLPVASHAPFPADVVNPTMGANLSSTTTVALEWAGSDVDNDIVEYMVYLSTTNPPANNIGSTTSTTLNANVSSNNTYYWKVITKDSQGNTSVFRDISI